MLRIGIAEMLRSVAVDLSVLSQSLPDLFMFLQSLTDRSFCALTETTQNELQAGMYVHGDRRTSAKLVQQLTTKHTATPGNR